MASFYGEVSGPCAQLNRVDTPNLWVVKTSVLLNKRFNMFMDNTYLCLYLEAI